MLTSYQSDTALLLNDPSNQFWSTSTLTTLINRARREIAYRTLCIQVLASPVNTVASQETYALSLANSLVTNTAGVSQAYGVIAISSSQGNYKPALGRIDFPGFQASQRIMAGTFQNYPWIFAQLGRGANATIYLFPIPAGVYAMDWITTCEPINLGVDTDPEAIPYPWTEIVPFKAAALAYVTQQRWTDAAEMDEITDKMLADLPRAEVPFMQPDWYGQPA